MLGRSLSDPHHVEEGGQISGLGLLAMDTVFEQQKVRTRVDGRFSDQLTGALQSLQGVAFSGYEIHMGVSALDDTCAFMTHIDDRTEGACHQNVYGSYLHGLFDKQAVTTAIVQDLCRKKGIDPVQMNTVNFEQYKQTQYDLLADGMRAHLDLARIHAILEGEI